MQIYHYKVLTEVGEIAVSTTKNLEESHEVTLITKEEALLVAPPNHATIFSLKQGLRFEATLMTGEVIEPVKLRAVITTLNTAPPKNLDIISRIMQEEFKQKIL